jgi:hypothetical protein
LRFFTITWSGSIRQPHRTEAAYLGLLEAVGQRLSLQHCHLKMLFSGFPLTCCCRRDTRDRLSEAEGRP